MNRQTFLDRYGNPHTAPSEACISKRTGVFGIFICENKILLSYPEFAPQSAELPGGGIDAGEEELEALFREVAEETTIRFPQNLAYSKRIKQTKAVYAIDKRAFWNYTEIYYVFDDPRIAPLLSEETYKPQDAFKSHWCPIEDINWKNMREDHKDPLKTSLNEFSLYRQK